MWNDFNTDEYSGMIAETITIEGFNKDAIRAYYSRPIGKAEYPALVLIPHMPGWDEFLREAARRFTEHGYAVLCPDIYARVGVGRPGEVARKNMEQGGLYDESVMGDAKGALDFLKSQPQSNGHVGVIGMCSGGRHAYLAACTVTGFDACVDCWGGGVVAHDESELTEKKPVAPIDYTEKLQCPVIGIFGNEDHSPTKDDVDIQEEALKKAGKTYEFYRYDGAGHGIWYYDKPLYRQEQAMDSWEKVVSFLDKNLKKNG